MPIEWWVTHSLDKTFPESTRPPGAAERIVLKAARNETEDAQVALRIPPRVEIREASFDLPDLVGAKGQTIPKEALSAWWVWYVYVLNNPPANRDPSSYLRKAPAFFPDAFLEEKTIFIRDDWTQPLWISVRVPRDTPAGDYHGTLGLNLADREGVKHHFDVPITVTVWPFALPDTCHLHHTEWCWPQAFSSYYHLEPWSAQHWAWMEKVAADMALHRQDMILTAFTELVEVRQTPSGGLKYDFSKLDRWVKVFKHAGLDWIEGSHVAGRGGGWESDFVWRRFRVLTASGRPVDTSRGKLSEEQFEKYWERFLKAVHAHLKKMGWADRYVQHVADEPIPANEKTWCYRAGKVREWLPGVPTIDAIETEGLTGYVDWPVPQIQEVGPERKRHPHEDLWTYTCLVPQGQYPNRFLDYPSIRNRIIFWLCWSLGLKGFLHWGYNSWRAWQGVPVAVPISPWTDASAGSIYCADRNPLPAGDPHIVYPGRNSICSSVRWEVVRKGIEDFEYLYLLEHALAGAKRSTAAASAARKLLARVRSEIAATPLRHTRDDGELLAAREQAGELLARLVGEK